VSSFDALLLSCGVRRCPNTDAASQFSGGSGFFSNHLFLSEYAMVSGCLFAPPRWRVLFSPYCAPDDARWPPPPFPRLVFLGAVCPLEAARTHSFFLGVFLSLSFLFDGTGFWLCKFFALLAPPPFCLTRGTFSHAFGFACLSLFVPGSQSTAFFLFFHWTVLRYRLLPPPWRSFFCFLISIRGNGLTLTRPWYQTTCFPLFRFFTSVRKAISHSNFDPAPTPFCVEQSSAELPLFPAPDFLLLLAPFFQIVRPSFFPFAECVIC